MVPPTTYAELAASYDALYASSLSFGAEKAAELCDIRDGACARSRVSRPAGTQPTGFCCAVACGDPDFPRGGGTCRHLGPGGCQIASLRCKLWFCSHVSAPTILVPLRVGGRVESFRTAQHPTARRLLAEAEYYGFVRHRGTRSDNLLSASRRWGLTIPQANHHGT